MPKVLDTTELALARAQRRERRATRRRKEILTAALRVFEGVGFEAASTRLIAQEADVSEGTIYNYFPDKGELCIQALKEGTALAFLVEQMQRRDSPFEEILSDLGKWRTNHMPRQSALLELLAEILARPKLRERYRDVIWEPAAAAFEAALASQVAQGHPLATPPGLAARIIMSSLLGLTLMSLADEQLRDLMVLESENTLARVHQILWRGLSHVEPSD